MAPDPHAAVVHRPGVLPLMDDWGSWALYVTYKPLPWDAATLRHENVVIKQHYRMYTAAGPHVRC